ncbi:MAG TPA: hypothetical protein VMC03_17850 [Streptosporangiaceae bacterium]|nr:hypothetical protein [Streptosporangiaceae bacterium]
MAERWDDDQLLAALRQAVRAREAVPPEFVEAGRSAFAWHNIDAELAQLTYDSSRDREYELSVRAEAASIRALTYTSAHLTVELEVTQDALVGQVVPAQAGTITVQPWQGPSEQEAVAVDEIGCFSIHPLPSGRFRLQCRTVAGLETLTGWIEL